MADETRDDVVRFSSRPPDPDTPRGMPGYVITTEERAECDRLIAELKAKGGG